MKRKIRLILLSLGVLAGFSFAQAPLKGYSVSKTTGNTLHSFSATAKTFPLGAADEDITMLWFGATKDTLDINTMKQGSELDLRSRPAAKEGFPLGFDFYYGEKKMSYIGISGSGMVFFSETSTFYPMIWSEYQTQMPEVHDFIFFQIKPVNSIYIQLSQINYGNSVIKSSGSTVLTYELKDEVFYIQYSNLRVYDNSASTYMEVTFQYAIHKDGQIDFVVGEMCPSGAPSNTEPYAYNYGFNFGLFSSYKSGTGESDPGCYLRDWNGTYNESYRPFPLTNETGEHPASGDCYSFKLPPECEAAPEEVVVTTWDVNVSGKTLNFGFRNSGMRWLGMENYKKAVLIVSRETSLTGDNLPQNGKQYKYGDTIGTSIAVSLMKKSVSDVEESNPISGIEPDADYYIYAFPYDDGCLNGPAYNTAHPSVYHLKTPILPPVKITVVDEEVYFDSLALQVEKSAGNPYLLTYSTEEFPDYGLRYQLPAGKQYQKGEKISMEVIDGYDVSGKVTVVNPEVSDEKITLTGLSENPYYFYAWSMKTDGTEYSAVPTLCAAVTLRRHPAEIVFSQEKENSVSPAGWTQDTTYPYEWSVIRPNRDVTDRYLSILQSMNEYGKAVEAAAISPVFEKNPNGGPVEISVDFYYYSIKEGGSVSAQSPKGKDSLFIQYRSVGEEDWNTIGVITSANKFTKGKYTFSGLCAAKKNFRLRFYSKSIDNNSKYAGIEKITTKAVEVCKPVGDISLVEDGLRAKSAKLVWVDSNSLNGVTPQGFHIDYKAVSASEWLEIDPLTAGATLNNLESLTPYVAEVSAVCSDINISEPKTFHFQTLAAMPYTMEIAGSEMPSGVSQKVAEIPASGEVVLAQPAENRHVWEVVEKGSGNKVLALDADTANANLWLVLPGIDFEGNVGEILLTLGLSATAESFSAGDVMRILVSEDGKYTAASVQKEIKLNEAPAVQTLEIPVSSARKHIALYTKISAQKDTLYIDSLDLQWLRIECNPVENIRQTNLTYNSATIVWDGSAYEYDVCYRVRTRTGETPNKYDTITVQENTLTLENLSSETAYEYFIIAYCESGKGNPAKPSDKQYFNTPVFCETPTVEVLSTTWQSVRVVMKSREKNRLINLYPQDRVSNPYINYTVNAVVDTVTVKGLIEIVDRNYYLRVRAVCGVGDSSAWSEQAPFILTYPDTCGEPTDLKATVNKAKKSALLSWKNGENNNFQILVLITPDKNDTIYSSSYATSQTVYNLQEDYVYKWSLMAYCEEYIYSKKVSATFSLDDAATESVQTLDKLLRVRATADQIIVDNPYRSYIRQIEVYAVNGSLLRTYPVNATEGVFIPHTLPEGLALIRIVGEKGEIATYKTVIK